MLNVISRSPTELQPVLDAIAATAARLCESMDATVWRVAGGRVRVVAQFGSPHQFARSPAVDEGERHRTCQSLIGELYTSTTSLRWWIPSTPMSKRDSSAIGHRTMLAAPLLSQGEALACNLVRKNRVHPFSDRQISSPADLRRPGRHRHREHAAVRGGAGAHARADEALEQQTATSRSAAASSAARRPSCSRCSTRCWRTRVRLCEAQFGIVFALRRRCVSTLAAARRARPTLHRSHREPYPHRARPRASLPGALHRRKRSSTLPMCSSRSGVRLARSRCHRSGIARMLGVPLLQRRTSRSAPSSLSRGSRGRSPTSRSSWSRPSPTKPSSPSRTRGCSRRSRRASASCRNRSNTRPRPATCSSVISRSPIDLQPCSTRIVETRSAPVRGRHAHVSAAATATLIQLARDHG